MFILIRRSFFFFPLIAICFVLIPSRTAAQNADLSIVKSGPATATAGSDITYDIGVSNFSGEASTPDNVLTDTLPAGVTFVSETHPFDWNCTTPAVGAGGTITCTNSNPLPDEYGTAFSFGVHIASDVATDTVISNTASISHSGSDPNSGNNDSTWNTTIGEPPPPPLPPLNPHDVLISEFRLSGPNGNSDEYIELYCNRDVDCDISGAAIRNYDPALPGDQGPGDLSYTFPSNTIIPARQYLLVGDQTQYSLSSYGNLDFDVHNAEVPDYFTDNQGFQLVSGGEPLVLDSVGFIGGGDDVQFIEGTGLQPATSRPADQYAYVRKRTIASNYLPQDTDNNADDFVLVSVTGTVHPGITAPPVLGAPGPQGLTSPLSYANAEVTVGLTSPSVAASGYPNRQRDGEGNSGTLKFRRSFTNNTNQTFDYIAFRVVEIPTLNSPNTLDDQAQLRLLTSDTPSEVFTIPGRGLVDVEGTTLEYDPGCGCEPAQPNGGGLNSTVSIVETNIPPGATIDASFLLQVDKAGAYRFYVYVEAFPSQCQGCDAQNLAPKSNRLRAKVTPHLPRKMINFKETPSKNSVTKKSKRAPVPTKSFGGRSSVITPAATPVRIVILNQPALAPKRKRKKTRIRHRSSAALRAKAEAQYANNKLQN